MPWLKVVHIVAVIAWAGSLTMLLAAIRVQADPRESLEGRARRLLLGYATPFALAAIASGTLVFVLHGPIVPWLAAKLGFVCLLVLGHATCGWLVLRTEHTRGAPQRRDAIASAGAAAACLASLLAVAVLVLLKPE